MALRSLLAPQRGMARFTCLACLALAAGTVAFEPSAAAQGTGTAPKPGDVKKPNAKPGAPAAPATAPATTPESTAPAAEAPKPAVEPVDDSKEVTRAVYISLDLAFARADVGGISNNTGFDKTAANGVVGGLGVGYRYKELRLGARFRDTSTTQYSLWAVMGEIGYGLPFRPVSPIFTAHAGYMFDSGIERSVIASALPKGNVLTPAVNLNGLVVGGELCGSVWLTKFLRVGPFIGVDFTFLHRSQVGLPQSIVPLSAETKQNALFSDSGSGVGYIFNLGVRGTGDIGF